jgi:poly-gamma-glutamate capsule biosynthesis protein CapA/YwtB (metallophosphatase superfamily)
MPLERRRNSSQPCTDMTKILAVGDVGAKRDDPGSIFDGCRDVFAGGDVVFAQLETTVTDCGARSPNAKLAMRAPSTMADATRQAGIDVMSFASNHCLDWGYEGFCDTLDHMDAAGVALCGAGATIDEARKPAIAKHDDLRIAFLAYNSILPDGYGATTNTPGCASIRAHTVYSQIEHDQPGTPARILSYPYREDLLALLADIDNARACADIVLVSFHWGLHMVEAEIADYQRIVAHAAIDAGADAILGHHPHILKGIEFYRGAPVFYSLGNFAIEQPHVWDPEITKSESFRHLVSLNPAWNTDQVYMLPEDTRMTGIVRLFCQEKRIARVEFLPAWIGDDSTPEMLHVDDARFAKVRDYLLRISESQGFDTHFQTADSCLHLSGSGNVSEEKNH